MRLVRSTLALLFVLLPSVLQAGGPALDMFGPPCAPATAAPKTSQAPAFTPLVFPPPEVDLEPVVEGLERLTASMDRFGAVLTVLERIERKLDRLDQAPAPPVSPSGSAPPAPKGAVKPAPRRQTVGAYSPVYNVEGDWHPSDAKIAEHIASVHGISPGGMSRDEMLMAHDRAHGVNVVAPAPVAVKAAPPRAAAPRRVATASPCPGGVCPYGQYTYQYQQPQAFMLKRKFRQ